MVNISVLYIITRHTTPSSKRVAEKIILSIAHKMENNSKFLIVGNYRLLQLDIIKLQVFVTYRQT